MVRHKRLRRASEAYALFVLEELGYNIVEVRRPLVVDGVEVSDIDVVAEKNGTLYAVEVKSGPADVTSVRQAYTNALLAGMKPLLLARGIDEAARAVAERLGVEVIVLPDMLVAGYEDLRDAVREAVYSVIEDFSELVYNACKNASENDLGALEALGESETIADLAGRLGLEIGEAARLLAELRKRGLIPRGSFRIARIAARMVVALCSKDRRRVV